MIAGEITKCIVDEQSYSSSKSLPFFNKEDLLLIMVHDIFLYPFFGAAWLANHV